jgi:hypothetical protein
MEVDNKPKRKGVKKYASKVFVSSVNRIREEVKMRGIRLANRRKKNKEDDDVNSKMMMLTTFRRKQMTMTTTG